MLAKPFTSPSYLSLFMERAQFPPLLLQPGVSGSEHCKYTQPWQTHKSEQRAGLYIQISVVRAGAGKDGELTESDTPQPAQRRERTRPRTFNGEGKKYFCLETSILISNGWGWHCFLLFCVLNFFHIAYAPILTEHIVSEPIELNTKFHLFAMSFFYS